MAEGQQESNGTQITPINIGNKRAWWKIKWENLGIGLPGVWLAILYIVLGTFVVLSLSAHQLQYQIYSLNADREQDQQISVWQILQTHAQWEAIGVEIDSQARQLNILAQKQALAELEYRREQADNWRLHNICRQQMTRISQKLSTLAVEKPGCIISDYSKIEAAIDEEYSDAQDDGALKKELVELLKAVEKAENSSILLASKEIEWTNLGQQFNDLNIALAENNNKREALLKKDNLGNKAGDFLNALDYMGNKEALPIVPSFTRMPSDTLKLILVLSMGALGGTISLTRSYLAQKKSLAEDRIGGAYYTFRPFLGAITALSIFILAKAGVLIISTPDQGAGGAELSPYFLSFIGIISGMLADSALDTIQRTGNNWFKNSEVSRDLWAYGLGKALAGDPNATKEQRDKNLEDNMALLSETLDVSVPTIKKWVDEKQKVPASMQALISAFVRIPPRELFSDVGGDLNVTKMWFAEEWKKNSEST